MFISQTTDFHFANYRFSFRKLQISISQTTDFHFANYRFSFRKLQISISQTTDFHFANYRFPFRKLQIPILQTTDFHFHIVSSHFVSQTTVSPSVLVFLNSRNCSLVVSSLLNASIVLWWKHSPNYLPRSVADSLVFSTSVPSEVPLFRK